MKQKIEAINFDPSASQYFHRFSSWRDGLMEETTCIASHFADDFVGHMLFKCEEMLFSWGFSSLIKISCYASVFTIIWFKWNIFAAVPTRFEYWLSQAVFLCFFGVFPYFLLFPFSFTPFSTALPFPKLPVFYESDIFESNRNIFLFSSAHDIHSVLRLESAAMFKAKPRLSGWVALIWWVYSHN